MINSNSFNPKNVGPAGETQGEVLKKIHQEYGSPEDKNREPVKKLGKDEFFKLMVTQIKNQDPTSPYKNEQMAAQMAQFTSLEQMFNVNQNLEKLAEGQQPLHQLGAAALIGKFVTSDSSQFSHTEGKYSGLSFNVPVDDAKVRVSIINQKGEVVREIERSGLKKGDNKIDWDGRRSNNMLAPSGAYSLRISAENAQGRSVPVTTSKKFEVHGVGFEGRETVLFVGDSAHPDKVLLKTVSRIEDSPKASPATAVNQEQPLEITAPTTTPSDALVPDVSVGQSAAFTPVTPEILRQVGEKPDVLPEPTVDDMRRRIAERDDLTAANPNAGRIK